MPTARNDAAGILGSDGKIYVIGGSADLNVPIGVVERFNETTLQWESVAGLPAPTGGAAAAKDKMGRIWLFGGYAAGETTNAVYRYDIPGDQWIWEGRMPTPRTTARAVTDSQGLIYLIGGATPTGNGLRSVQKFDPTQGTWTDLPDLNVGRHSHGAFVDGNDRIFVVGGVIGSAWLDSVECLDLRNLAAGWVFKAPRPAARQVYGTLGADGLYYALGGWNGDFIDSVDRYDPATDTWSAYAPLNYGNATMPVVTGASGRMYSIGGESEPMYKTARVEYTDVKFAHVEMIASIVIQGTVGQTYRIDYASRVGGTTSWTTLTNVTLPSSPFRVVDWESAGLPSRFYRTVLAP